MRIVAGYLKGRAIVAPDGQGTRPTSDRARQASFNVLEHAAWAEPIADARVIDLYAGSGALGFEAVSRGAGFCLFVETDEAARLLNHTDLPASEIIADLQEALDKGREEQRRFEIESETMSNR